MRRIRKCWLFYGFMIHLYQRRLHCLLLVSLICGVILVTSNSPAALASSSTWNTGASAPLARFEAQGLVTKGKLYLLGGFYDTTLRATTRVDVYDIATNRWNRLANLPEPLTHAAQVVDGNTIYIVGGYVGNNPGPSTAHVWKYNISSDTWHSGPALPASRGAGAAVVLGRNLHFFGGATRTNSKASTKDQADQFVLNLDTGTSWTTAKPLPNPRNHLGATVLDGKAYVIGGQHTYNEGTTSQKQVDIYDPTTDTWHRAADLPTGRSHISASTFELNGRIIVIGGSVNNGTSGSASAEVLSYNPQSDSWQRLPPLPSRRKTPVAGMDGTRIVVSTGGLASATSTTWTSTEQAAYAAAPTFVVVQKAEPGLLTPGARTPFAEALFVCDLGEAVDSNARMGGVAE